MKYELNNVSFSFEKTQFNFNTVYNVLTCINSFLLVRHYKKIVRHHTFFVKKLGTTFKAIFAN